MLKEILFIPIMLLFIAGFIIAAIYASIFRLENVLSDYIDRTLDFVEAHNTLCIIINTIFWIIIIHLIL